MLKKENTNDENKDYFISKNNLNFPTVKFYLPTLRDKYTRFIPI